GGPCVQSFYVPAFTSRTSRVRSFFPIESGTGTTASSTIGRRHGHSLSLEALDKRILRSSMSSSNSSYAPAFESRTMTSHQPRQNHKLILGDRLITALLCGLWGFATAVFACLVAFHFVLVPMNDVAWTLCTWTTWTASGVAAALGFLLEPERIMDGFGIVWG